MTTDNCYYKGKLPAMWSAPVSQYCSRVLGGPACTITVTASQTTINRTVKVTPTRATSVATVTNTVIVTNVNPSNQTIFNTVIATNVNNLTATNTNTVTATSLTTCTGTPTTISVTVAAPTFVNYVSRTPNGVRKNKARHIVERATSKPSIISAGCRGAPPPSKEIAACDCFLRSTVTVRPTATRLTTVTLSAQTTVQTVIVNRTQTAQVTSVQTVQGTVVQIVQVTAIQTVQATVSVTNFACGTTVIPTVNVGTGGCGPVPATLATASTSGSVTCPNNVPTPSANIYFHIEGLQSGEGTIFEGCITSGPRNVTTPSGGTHECDGTNNGANPFPGTTPTDLIDAAGRQEGFDYDGGYYNQYQDYFISTISATSQGGDNYWGVLDNLVYTPTGGCQYLVNPGDQTQWIFNSFNFNSFLRVQPAYAIAQAGQGTVTVQVQQTDGNGGGFSPAGGASFAGVVSGSDGSVTIPVPSTPGCYQYKAQRGGAAISNAYYLNVVAAFA